MKLPNHHKSRSGALFLKHLRMEWNIYLCALTISTCAIPSAKACTIFVLNDGQRTLFFNNEDFKNPATRIWFVPAGKDFLGCAWVGFDDGWAQGGVNTAGLAFDWVAGAMEKWEPDRSMKPVRGNPAQRLLESCKTVEEAITFFKQHREPSFSTARILIADRTGASVIIGAKDNKLTFRRSSKSQGFGYGGKTLEKMLGQSPAPVVAEGLPILRACLQKGEHPTQYANVFALHSGEIRMFPSTSDDDGIKLNLSAELAKGGHYYDIPLLREQMDQPPRPLRNEIKRFHLDELQSIEDLEPEVTKRIRTIILDWTKGTIREEDFTREFWAMLLLNAQNIEADRKRLGGFISLTLVGRNDEGKKRNYRYATEFSNFKVLQHYVLDEEGRIASIKTEAAEERKK